MGKNKPRGDDGKLQWYQHLNVQLIIVIVVLVAVSFDLLGITVISQTKRRVLQREFHYLSLLSGTYSLHLSQQVDKTRSIVNAYSYDSSLRDALLGASKRQAFFLLGFAREASAYLEDIVLADLNGDIIVSGSMRMEGENIGEYAAFKLCILAGQSAIDRTAVLSKARAPSIGIAAPIFYNNKVVGALVGIFNLERFGIDFLVNNLPDPDSEVFVIDARGCYVIHPDRDLIFQPVQTMLLDRMRGSLVTADAGGDGSFSFNNRMYSITSTAILPWIMGVGLDASVILHPLNRISWSIALGGLVVAMGLSASLFIYLRRLIVSPVLSLRARIAGFEDDLKPVLPEFGRINELFLLENQFSQMTDGIAEKNQRISTMYQQLLQAEKLASLGGLVAGLSHEMNTPLGNSMTLITSCREKIDNFVKSFETRILTRSEFEDFLQFVDEAVNHVHLNVSRAARLVRDLKQVAVDQGSMRKRYFFLREITDEVITTITHRIKQRPIDIVNDIDPKIRLNSYPGPLEQVITNLISNSLHHGFSFDKSGEIRISAALSDGRVTLEYRDNGQGIAESMLTRVFDPFFTSKMGQGGTGLGLFLVQNIIHGGYSGDISVDSRPGEGVHFNFTFPEDPPDKPREDLDFLSLA